MPAETASPRRFRAVLARIQPYNAGLSADHVKARYGVQDVTKLASNENPLGASDRVSAAIIAAAKDIALYPDAHSTSLRALLASTLAVEQSRVVVGNGSEDLLNITCRAFLNPDDEIVVSSPTFSVCADSATVMGARVVDVPRRADMEIDVDGMIAAIGPNTKLLYLCNPNNPTGNMIARGAFERLCRAAGPDTLIVVDEAYYEFAREEDGYPDSLSFLAQLPAAWLILRTFSKAYGLAGLRVGYGIASDDHVARQIEIVRMAFNVNNLAQAAAAAAWADQDHVDRSVSLNRTERRFMEEALRARGFAPIRSATNFLFFDSGLPARDVADRLLRLGIIIKPWGGVWSTYIRVSIGNRNQNERFLEAFDQAVTSQ